MEEGRSFGAGLDLRALRTELPPDTLVPGVAVYSRRADPLAAWTNGLDLAAVGADTDRAFLILETGFNQRCVHACVVLLFVKCTEPGRGGGCSRRWHEGA